MQQRNRRLFLVLGGACLVSLGILAACSSETTTTPLPGQNTGTDSGRDTGKKEASVEDTDGSDIDGGADCGKAPKPKTTDSVYCGSENDAGCKPADNQICCADEKIDGTFSPRKCATATVSGAGFTVGACGFTTDAGGREWHCTEPSQCPGATACCVIKGNGGDPRAQPDTKEFPGCGNFFNNSDIRFVGGTRCKTECGATELTLCASDDDCATGTCRYINLSGRFTGVCQ